MQTDIEMDPSVSAVHVIVMLYEEAIRSMGRAAVAAEEGDVEARCAHVERAITVVADLYSRLDMEQGGEIAERLAVAYRLVLARLVLVNGHNDADLARDAASLLKPLLDSWRRIELDLSVASRKDVAVFAAAAAEPDIAARALPSTV